MTDYNKLFNDLAAEASKSKAAKQQWVIAPVTPDEARLFRNLAQKNTIRTYNSHRLQALVGELEKVQKEAKSHTIAFLIEELLFAATAVWFKDTAMRVLLLQILDLPKETHEVLVTLYQTEEKE
jgi:hypothetical protein